MATPLGRELDTLQDVGNGAIAVFKAVVIVAIVAVILGNGSATVQVVQQAFGFLIWLVSLVVAPITGGSNVDLADATPFDVQSPANPASTTLQTSPTSILPGVINPSFATPNQPLQTGVSPPETGGGFGQF
jgi:hypothetical protein